MADQQRQSEYRCSQCNQAFNSNDELRRHNEQAHGQTRQQSQTQNPSQGRTTGAGAGSGSNR